MVRLSPIKKPNIPGFWPTADPIPGITGWKIRNKAGLAESSSPAAKTRPGARCTGNSFHISQNHWKNRHSHTSQPFVQSNPSCNGFTILEILMVLLIVSVLVWCTSLPIRSDSLTLFSRNLLSRIEREQFLALETRRSRKVAVDRQFLETENGKTGYPQAISCQPQVLTFNAKGNISKGGTITCAENGRQIRLVFQIGAGKGRVELD